MPAPSKIVPLDRLLELRRQARNQGLQVVFTNGCFDLIHLGHVRYLEEAKALGDILIVGLNSDDSTRRIKGEKRPLIPEDERAQILAALTSVDYVVVFGDDTAERAVEALRPDIYVKGGDYAPTSDGVEETGKPLPEGEVVRRYGGQVALIPFLPGHSTTDLINVILKKYCGN
jgi:D-glycero-beta-D-manno-heptose 1-phosphate adenylyltransferase